MCVSLGGRCFDLGEEFAVGCAGRRGLSVNQQVCSDRVAHCRTTRLCGVYRNATHACVHVCESTGGLPTGGYGRRGYGVVHPSSPTLSTGASSFRSVAGRRLVHRLLGTEVTRTELGGNCTIGKSNAMVLCNGGGAG